MKSSHAASFLLLVALPCCQATPSPDGTGVHVVQPKDIPVPAGMRLVTRGHASNSLEAGDYRFVNLVYQGSTPVAQVAEYMLQRMPQHSYELVSQDRKHDQEHLRFRRGRYVSDCTISRRDYGTQMKVQLRTTLKP